MTVVPAVSLGLQAGSGGATDLLTVSAPYAQRGDVVVVQVSAAGGAWTYLRQGTLGVLHGAVFVVSAAGLTVDRATTIC